MITWLDSLLLGLVQGITEYLPISSSAHLLLYHLWRDQDLGLAFDVFLHIGTLAATLVYFYTDWRELLKNPIQKSTQTQGISLATLAIATVPALALGYFCHDWIESALRSHTTLIVTLPLGGLALYAVDRWSSSNQEVSTLGPWKWLCLGVFQSFALIPGISRSGATITAARFLGLKRGDAARVSFLMSAPVTLAAVAYELKNWKLIVLDSTVSPVNLGIGLISSFVFGVIAIHGLLVVVKRFSYLSFAIYRVLLAIVVFYSF